MFTPLKNLPEGKNWTLEELNDREVQLLIPVIIYMSITMVVGTVGNALVLYVNIFVIKLRQSTHRYCITFLALVDIAFCVIGKPFSLMVLTHPYTFPNMLVCKTLRAFSYFIGCLSILVLFTIAFDRYRRVCRPHGNQFSVQSMQRMFGTIVVICFILSIPCFILYGNNTVQTGIANITGIQCFQDDKYKNTMFYNGYIMFLYSILIILTACISLFYLLVWREVKNHVNEIDRNAVSCATETNMCCGSTGIYEVEMSPETTTTQSPHNVQETLKTGVYPGKYASEEVIGRVSKKAYSRAKNIRVSKILFVVSASFVLSFTPFLFLEILTLSDEQLIVNLDNASTVFYQLFWRSVALHFVVNPFIYNVMDRKFKMHCKSCVSNKLCH
ncbi:hypothetical protein ACJMK2_003113 [Sinanodonta woodiana]|uniref:G-protein coupled receptors family 1 profile domain-containing protein n=1 Tax=Sinanodonta woodiana TaxID=1069815 RepID=A0ABD3XZI0_SINWO